MTHRGMSHIDTIRAKSVFSWMLFALLGIHFLWKEAHLIIVVPLYLMGLQSPLASFTYELEIANKTKDPLIVTASLINDLPDEVLSERERRFFEQAGWIRDTERLVAPNEVVLVSLPSHEENRLGLVLLTARTGHDRSMITAQRIGLFLQSWPWKNGMPEPSMHEGINDSGRQIVIQEQDLVTFDAKTLMQYPGDSLARQAGILAEKMQRGLTGDSNQLFP